MKIPVIEWFEKKQCDMIDMRQVEQSLLYKTFEHRMLWRTNKTDFIQSLCKLMWQMSLNKSDETSRQWKLQFPDKSMMQRDHISVNPLLIDAEIQNISHFD